MTKTNKSSKNISHKNKSKTLTNKRLSYYMSLPYKLEIVKDPDEGGFVSYYPDLPGCISSGDSEQEAAANAQDAKHAWIEAALESKINIKEPSYHELNDYSGQFKLRLPKELHRQLAEQSQAEGISMNQYCVYLLSQNNAIERILERA